MSSMTGGILIPTGTTANIVSAVGNYMIDTVMKTLFGEEMIKLVIVLCVLGLSVGIISGLLYFLGFKSKDLRGFSSMNSNGVSDAYYAKMYLDSGGDIKNASNQEFIRKWAQEEQGARAARGFSSIIH